MNKGFYINIWDSISFEKIRSSIAIRTEFCTCLCLRGKTKWHKTSGNTTYGGKILLCNLVPEIHKNWYTDVSHVIFIGLLKILNIRSKNVICMFCVG